MSTNSQGQPGSRGWGLDAWLCFLFVASLPLFSLRFFGMGISMPLVIMLMSIVWVVFSVLIAERVPRCLSGFDGLIGIYLLLALVWLFGGRVEGAVFAWFKTAAYFFYYLCLKIMLSRLGASRAQRVIISGIAAGSVIFSIMAANVVVRNNIEFGLDRLHYYGFTFEFFRHFIPAYSGVELESGGQVMRNALGEVFAFFAIFIFLSSRGGRSMPFFLVANVVFMFVTFSRRAFVAFMASALGYPFFRRSDLNSRKKILGWGMLIAVSLGVFAVGLITESRVVDLDLGSRSSQYLDALNDAGGKFFLGHGYAAKLGGEYVHNFVISGLYMMGVSGLVVSLCIYLWLLIQYAKAFFTPTTYSYGALLVVPVLGATVASTVEGVFTPVGWLAIALFSCERRESRAKADVSPLSNAL